MIIAAMLMMLPECSTFAQENAGLCPDGNHPHMIDLGLPSGTKWACCNVGADSPRAFGGYYAWGEKEEKDTYSEATYLYASWDGSKGDYVWEDIGGNISGTGYDVATSSWGEGWRMPSLEQLEELLGKCTYELHTESDTQGILFKGDNGNSLFIPFAGARMGKKTSYVGSYSFCWSGTASPSNAAKAYMLKVFPNGYAENLIDGRHYGISVRPVSTGISKVGDIMAHEPSSTSTCYTIYGVRIKLPDSGCKPGKGIYIRDGKKFVVR